MEIYVLIDDQPKGPYTPDLIRQHLKSGALQPSMLAAYAGSADWQPLAEMVRSWDSAKGTRFSPASTPGKRTVKPTPWLAIAGVIVVLIAAAAGFVWWKKTRTTKAAVSTAALPDLGYPNTLAEWNTAYAVPPAGQNAATYYLKAFDAMQVTNSDYESKDLPIIGKAALPALGTPLPPRTKAAVAAFTKRNKAAWELVQQGTKFGQCRYPMDLTLGPDTPLPHLSKLRLAGKLGQLLVLEHAENKQASSAMEVIHTSLIMAQSLQTEPTVIAQLLRTGCFSANKESMERMVNSVTLPATELEKMASVLVNFEADEVAGLSYTRALAIEKSILLDALGRPPEKIEGYYKMVTQGAANPELKSATNQPVPLAKVTQKLSAQKSFGDETYRHAIAMRGAPLPERLKISDYIISRAEEARTNELFFTSVMLNGLGRVSQREARGLAQLRLMQAAIALERYRAANNRYPMELKDLTPAFLQAVTQDPFNGNPLRYKQVNDGYEMESSDTSSGKPITFKVIKPPKAR